MTKPGPRSRPTALKLLHGETHLDRLNLNGPRPRLADPVPPPDASPEVLEVWGAVVAELQDMDTAYASDADSLRCYCEAVVIHRKASALLAQSAILIKGLHGGLVRNPALQIQRDAAQTIRPGSRRSSGSPRRRVPLSRSTAAARSTTTTRSPARTSFGPRSSPAAMPWRGMVASPSPLQSGSGC
jgi:P27 family predicted phage terminase small subunit